MANPRQNKHLDLLKAAFVGEYIYGAAEDYFDTETDFNPFTLST